VGLDSATLLELVSGLEEAFGFVEDVTEENFRSIAGLARYAQEQMNGTGEPSAC
jgi:acyl carrier protein